MFCNCLDVYYRKILYQLLMHGFILWFLLQLFELTLVKTFIITLDVMLCLKMFSWVLIDDLSGDLEKLSGSIQRLAMIDRGAGWNDEL